MGKLFKLKYLNIVILCIMILLFVTPGVAKAQGVALSGSFYRQHFKLVPGESVNSPEIHVVVFNNESESIRVKLVPGAPEGVEIILTESEFDLQPGDNKKVEVGLHVDEHVLPGDYILTITAEVQGKQSGIAVKGASQQQAQLTIFGEASDVKVTAVDCFGEIIPVELHVCRIEEAIGIPCGFSMTGIYEDRYVPGEYVVQAFLNDIELNKQRFIVKADEPTNLVLTVSTVFVEGFSVVPNYYEETGIIAFVEVTYNIRNVYKQIQDVTATLIVTRDSTKVDEDSILSVPMLDVGSTGGSYKYLPIKGWAKGEYTFRLVLKSDKGICADEVEEQISVDKVSASQPSGETNNTFLFIGLGAGAVIVIIVVFWLVARRRRSN